MESDAGGQVGGLQCSPEQRKQLAEQSRSWRCEGCGKANAVILQESKDAAQELGEARTEEETPAELKIGYKDEKKQNSNASLEAPAGAASAPAAVNTQRIPPPVPQPVQTPVQPTSPAPPHAQPPVPAPINLQQEPLPEVETPWLDRIIWTFMALLVAVVLRRYLDA
jgi:ubiquitin-conjugating enzyme E2 J1